MGAGPREEAALAPGAAARPAPAPGGSFLGTAASTAAGVIGGSLLLDSIRSMMGHGHGAFGIADPASAAGHEHGSPWDNSGGGDLSRQAGADDIGRDQHQGGGGRSGLLGDGAADHGTDAPPDQDVQDAGDFDDDGGDFGGGDFGGDDSTDV